MKDSIHPVYTNDNYFSGLSQSGINYSIILTNSDVEKIATDTTAQIYLIDCRNLNEDYINRALDKCNKLTIPTLLLLSESESYLHNINFGDFVMMPTTNFELLTRVKKLITKPNIISDSNLINVRGLSINKSTYEVTVHNQRIPLRFKEYEMLLLMATNVGKVYSREDLLSQIWGYDYFGGIRTVDVHIRRLRSKIEDGENIFIETVWNVGYRFKN